jgi:hypothetical protein
MSHAPPLRGLACAEQDHALSLQEQGDVEKPPHRRAVSCSSGVMKRTTSSMHQRRPDRTQRTWLADRTAGYIADSVASAGSASATVGPSHPVQSRRCSAPAQRRERCGPPMSAACTVRTIVEKVGVASSAMRGRRSIYAVSPCCSSADQTQRRRPLDVGLQRDNGARADILRCMHSSAIPRA